MRVGAGEPQRRHHLVAGASAAQLVVQEHRVLGDEAAARRYVLVDEAWGIGTASERHRRRAKSLIELLGERALFFGAPRLPVAGEHERRARYGGGGQRPAARAERV